MRNLRLTRPGRAVLAQAQLLPAASAVLPGAVRCAAPLSLMRCHDLTTGRRAHQSASRRVAGFTLVEMLSIVMILSIVSAMAIPNISPRDAAALDLVVIEVSEALRFARNEAIRSGQPHGVRFRMTLNKIEVFRLDISGTPTEIYDVRHPLDKHIYDIDLNTLPFASGATAAADFRYAVSGAASLAVAFDARGEPMAANDLDPLFQDGSVTVSYGNHSAVVAVATITGRVTTQ